ncbi:branched-chain amino acid transport system II carrier protein [Aerococcaceae bacterium zg-BR22]|uniref:branched-chain amino acid transport system II carrier protein n=1 Tax=Aerococcaceae bacterium zg-1292 TaxID=2774330 RepID=UPI0040645930|nr:branched-chain amino acid transport system II carrier protein [Aerococcaceae bacterium zg-BR22]
MEKLSRSQFLQVSIMLFGLFFGAGNLIFPPLLGNQAGSMTMIALLSFAITAVVFPVAGAIVVGKTEGLSHLANRVGPLFSLIFTTAIYVSIGPGLGIPRAGSVPFEMAIAPYLPVGFNPLVARLVYTALFFSVAMWICLKPSKLVERVGKYLTPTLLVMITLMFLRVIFLPKQVAAPVGNYQNASVVQGFLEGYNTMDAVAALNFGFVVSMAIKNFGIKDKKSVTRYTMKAGLLAGVVLFAVYAMLSSIGMVTSGQFVGAVNGAFVLSESMRLAFGEFGAVFLAAIFTLACLTTCVGLITSGSEYFHTLFGKKLSYQAWVVVWSVFSFVMANFGLNNLLAYSVPLLTVIYPVALVLIVLGVTHDWVRYSRLVYVVAAFLSVGLPIVDLLASFGVKLPYVTDLSATFPMATHGLSWLMPTLVAVVFLTLVEKLFVFASTKLYSGLVGNK